MARILVTATEAGDGAIDADRVRAVLAKVWRPEAILDTVDTTTGAAALARQCWEHWGGHTIRHRLPADSSERAAAEAMRAGTMVTGPEVLGVVTFTTDGHPDLIAALAELAGIPVWLVAPTPH